MLKYFLIFSSLSYRAEIPLIIKEYLTIKSHAPTLTEQTIMIVKIFITYAYG